jgi:phospholipid N-methyltransferase
MHLELLQIFALLVTALVAIRLLRRSDSRRVAFTGGLDSQREELWLFFRQWLSRPLTTAAFSPSSRFLNRRMVQAIPPGARRVIELGAGTGALTRTLIEHGIAVDDLLAIEFNPSLHRYLSRRFPRLAVVRGDARAMDRLPEVVAFARRSPVQAVVSGLGLLSMSREAQYSILSSAFELMPGDGSFVQFTYGPLTPVAGEVMRWLGLRARRHGFTLCNLPPASVYVFSRDRGRAG